jgi:hypothetical protein
VLELLYEGVAYGQAVYQNFSQPVATIVATLLLVILLL